MTVSKTTKANRRTIASLRVTARIAEQLGIFGKAHARWACRDDNQADPALRGAADMALDAITAMSRHLADVRTALISQIAINDAAAAARTLAAVEKSARNGAVAGASVCCHPGPSPAEASAPVMHDASPRT